MGTYEQPAIIPPADMTEGLKQMRAGTQSILAGATAGAKAKAARKAKEKADKDKKAKELYKTVKSISSNFDKNNFGIIDIDSKFDYFTKENLTKGYYIKDKDIQDEYYKNLLTKSKNTQQLIAYMNKSGDQLADMYTIVKDPLTGESRYEAKAQNVDGAGLNTNVGVKVDAFIDYKINAGKHGEFYNDENSEADYGYKYFYPVSLDPNNFESRQSWEDFDNSTEGQLINNKVAKINNDRMAQLGTDTLPQQFIMTSHKYMLENPDDPAIANKYKIMDYAIVANDLNSKISSGDRFVKQFSLKEYNKKRQGNWDRFGKTIYSKYDKSAFTTESNAVGANGKEVKSKIVNYDIANKEILSNYMSQAYSLGVDQNLWQGLGFSGQFNPSKEVDDNGMNDTYRAAQKMAELDIQNLAKRNFSTTDISNDENALKRNELKNNLPGLPGIFVSTKMQPGGPNGTMRLGTYNPIIGTTLAGMTVSSGAGKFGQLKPGQGGYSLADYETIAKTLVPGVNAGGLESFAGILTSMSAVNGREYEYGANLRSKFHVQFIPEAAEDALLQHPTLTRAQLRSIFDSNEGNTLTWASGNSFDVTLGGTTYTIKGKEEGYGGLNDIDEGGFYRTSGSYFNKLPVNDPYSALSLLFYEADISNSNAQAFLQEFQSASNPQNLNNQANTSIKNSTKSKINTNKVYNSLNDAQNAAGPNERAISDGQGGFVIVVQ